MDKAFRKRIVDRHSDSLLRYGYHPNALYWSNKSIQEIRFKVLAEIGVESGDSVLDVGCGFGDLSNWLDEQLIHARYTGLDISPHLLAVAREKHTGVDFIDGELKEGGFLPESFDWVLLSGALNEPYCDEGKYTYEMIAQMYTVSRKGVAFNLLNAEVVNAFDLQSFLPDEVLNFCQNLCSDCTLRTDYLENDFTIYMRKL